MATRKKLEAEVVNVTPELAEQMLKKNKSNRSVNRHHLLALSNAMENGDWQLNGQSVSFDSRGNLQDGQHRLSAVVKSGVTAPMLIVKNVDPGSRPTIDVGRKRTVADELAIRGESYTTALGSVLMMLKKLDKLGGTGASVVLTSVEAIAMLEERPEIRDAVARAERLKYHMHVPPSVLGYCAYKFNELNSEDAEQFWKVFETGQFNGATDPRFVLSRALNRLAADRDFSTASFSSKVILARMIIKAWNAYRRGREMRVMRVDSSGEFPVAV